jgi:3-methylcrotonyl-CoA carboxylase beta subunit
MLDTLRERHALVAAGGGARCASAMNPWKIMVRERIDLLLDPQTPVPRIVAAGGLGALWQRGAGRGHRHRHRHR